MLDTSTSFAPASAATRGADVHADSADVVAADLALAGVQPGTHSSCPSTSGDSRRIAVAGLFVGVGDFGH